MHLLKSQRLHVCNKNEQSQSKARFLVICLEGEGSIQQRSGGITMGKCYIDNINSV